MANVGACWTRAGTLNATLKGVASERTATVRGDGAVSGRTENGVVLSPVTQESTRHARETGGDVLTKERLKEKEPKPKRWWR